MKKKIKVIRLNKEKLRKIEPTKNPFLSLASSIIYQQISTKAGNAIYTKFRALFGKRKPSAKILLTFSDSKLRKAGISPQKLSYLRDLAQKFVDGSVEHHRFRNMTDAEVKEHLILVKGIGSWTADMFLIFALNRPDVLPVGDLGIMKGFQKVFNLRSLPKEAHMVRLARPYEGKRTYLSLYLWDSIDGGN
jgi:DNA-3-methyladenine glycosylase II